MRTFTFTLAALAILLASPAAFAAPGGETEAPVLRDGSHDFDPMLGVWKTEIKRTADPFAHPEKVVEMAGTVTKTKVWDGRGQLEQLEVEGPAGHWQGLTLFLYNPEAHQWSQNFAGSAQGVLQPPTIGSFINGRGEFYAQDHFNGRAILIRGVWSGITADSHHYEESYSDDGGRSWHTAFSAVLKRIEAAAP